MKDCCFYRSAKTSLDFYNACKNSDLLLPGEADKMPKPEFIEDRNGWKIGQEEIKNTVVGWKNNQRVMICFPGLDSELWDFDRCENPNRLFNAIDEFINRVGVAPSYPNQVARLIFEKRKSQLQTLSSDPKEYWKDFASTREKAFSFLRKPYKRELKKKFVFAFDKNAMFLSPMSEKMFSEQTFQTFEKIKIDKASDIKPGIYDCEIKYPKGLFLSKLLQTKGLFYSNYLKLLFENNCEIKINKCFIWEKPERLFEKFYKTVSTVKKDTQNSEIENLQIVNNSIKAVYTNFIGWLRSPRNANGYSSDYYRPDFHGLIVSLANANLLRNILTVQKKTKLVPFGINFDTVLYFADSFEEFKGTPLLNENVYSFEWKMEASKAFELIEANEKVGTICKVGELNEAKQR